MGDAFSFFTDDNEQSGGNGFPFAYAFTGPDLHHPAAAPFLKAHSWWWQVKNWSLASDAAIVDTDSNDWSIQTGTLAPAGGNATTELQLIQPARAHDFFDTAALPNQAVQFSLMGTGINNDSGTLYPGLGGVSQVGLNPSKGILEIRFDGLGTGLPSIAGTIDGVTVLVYYDATTFPPNSFTFSQFVLTVQDTWSY